VGVSGSVERCRTRSTCDSPHAALHRELDLGRAARIGEERHRRDVPDENGHAAQHLVGREQELAARLELRVPVALEHAAAFRRAQAHRLEATRVGVVDHALDTRRGVGVHARGAQHREACG
jgi:hypothetical protein